MTNEDHMTAMTPAPTPAMVPDTKIFATNEISDKTTTMKKHEKTFLNTKSSAVGGISIETMTVKEIETTAPMTTKLKTKTETSAQLKLKSILQKIPRQ